MIFGRNRLTEQARARSEIIKLMSGEEHDVYKEHLLKCAIYGNSTNNLWHWANEVAEVIVKINGMKAKTPSGKLHSEDYRDNLLLASGEDPAEFEENLEAFARKYKYKYPKFEITPELVDLVTDLFQFLSLEYSRKMSSTKTDITKDEVRNSIIQFLECRGVVK